MSVTRKVLRSDPLPLSPGHWAPASARLAALLLAAHLVLPSLQAISPSVQSVTPPGARRGSETEWTLQGARLDDAQEIVFLSPGFVVLALDAKKTNQIKAVVRIASDAALGEHLFRVRTLSGWSELRTFHVGSFPTLKEGEPNNEASRAQPLPPNTTVTGQLTSEDVDFFQFRARKGERWSAEVEGIRLGRVLFDPHLTLLNPEGKEIETADDSTLFLQDPILSFVAPQDGDYRIQLRDSSWAGGGEFHYRLHVGTYPRPTVAYPLGGPTSTRIEIQWLGDPKGAWTQTIQTPDALGRPFQLVPEAGELSSPSPMPFRLVSFPNVLESGSNRDRKSATASSLQPPLAFNGVLAGKAGKEGDWFRFQLPSGSHCDIQVYARRLRSPLDPILTLMDDAGKTLDSNDDSNGPDSALKLKSEEGGVYYLRIQDQLGRSGADFAYRIEIVPVQPRIVLNIPEVARNDSQTRQHISVPRGGRMVTLMQVKRSHYNGELSFLAENLPSGVQMEAPHVSPGMDSIPWVFTASADAPFAGALSRPLARPASKGSTTPWASEYRHVVELVRGGNDPYYSTAEDRLPVAVVPELPFEISFQEPSTTITRSGSAKVTLQIQRRPGFNEPVTLKLLGNPPGVSSENEWVVPKDQSSTEYPINAKADAALGTWKWAVLASAPWKGGTAHCSTALTPIQVTEPYVVGKLTTLNAEPGQEAIWTCALEHKSALPGQCVARIIGLPDSISYEPQTLDASSTQLRFTLKIGEKTKTGSIKGLSCVATIENSSKRIVQTIAGGATLRIVPPKRSTGTATASTPSPKP